MVIRTQRAAAFTVKAELVPSPAPISVARRRFTTIRYNAADSGRRSAAVSLPGGRSAVTSLAHVTTNGPGAATGGTGLQGAARG